MNPMALMHIKPLFEKFRDSHPKFIQFFGYAAQNVAEGSKLEIRITDPNGRTAVTNMILSADDLELLRQIRALVGGHSTND